MTATNILQKYTMYIEILSMNGCMCVCSQCTPGPSPVVYSVLVGSLSSGECTCPSYSVDHDNLNSVV